MARNKECLIIVLDVRQNVCEEFKQKSIKCAAEILKDKICSAKQDYVSFVLLGTERTFNDENQNVSNDDYLNIVQYTKVQLCTWQLLINFFKFVNEEACNEGEWLDALVVAMGQIRCTQDTLKVQRQRIVLFYDFNNSANSYDMFDVITENLMKEEIELTVISNHIQYIDNPASDEPQAIFSSGKKSDNQLENEKYALRLVTNCNAKLCNFNEALRTIFKFENKRPWVWNCKLSIGSKINIAVSGVIAIKNESNIKLKKCWGEPEEIVTRELSSYLRGIEVEPLDMDLINGYMLGSTPIAYDEALDEDKLQHEQGLKFLGFPKYNSIPEEYYTGDSLYWVVHQKNHTSSAKKMDALVKALLNTERAILCWKVYSAKFNNPKLVVLLPNALHPDKPASLSMIELAYHAQHHFWDFPTLYTQRTECSCEQLDAIDNLIDSMDLMLRPKDAQLPRDTVQNDLLPFDSLPHIYEQNIVDILERKILCNASDDDELFQEMLCDKNFVEVFWKLPESNEQKAKSAAKNIKKLFPLEDNVLRLSKPRANAGIAANANIKEEQNNNSSAENDNKTKIESVSQKSPADDFEKLLKYNVITESNNTLRDSKFHKYAGQMRSAVWNLLFKSVQLDAETIVDALKVYRKSCYDFNAFDDYNNWIREVKSAITTADLKNFWYNFIVNEKLGLCIIGETSLDEKLILDEFYHIDDAALSASMETEELNDTTVDDLLANV